MRKGPFFYRMLWFLCLLIFILSLTQVCQKKDMTGEDAGKNEIQALFLVSKNYGLNYFLMRDVFDQFGWRVIHTGVLDAIEACPPVSKQLGIQPIIPDILLSAIDDPGEYDCLVIPPGAGNYNPVPDSFADLLESPEALQFVKKAADLGLPVFTLCSGSRVLAAADVLRGKKMVGAPRFVEEYNRAGADYVGNQRNDHPPVIDGNIITGTRGQYYNVANCQAVATLVEDRQKKGKKRASRENFLAAREPSFLSGDGVWARVLGGDEAEGGRDVCFCPDGGFLVTGYTFSQETGDADVLVIKADEDGEVEWCKTLGGAGAEYGNACLCSRDGYLVAGYTSSFGAGSKDVYVAKLDEKGKEIWVKTFGGTSWDVGTALCESGDGNFFVCGYTHSFGEGEEDIYLIKIDEKGNKVWSKTFGGERLDMANSIVLTADGGLLIGATSGSFSDNTDFYLIRTDDKGEEIWSKTYSAQGPRGHAFDWCTAMTGTRDGGAILTGYTDCQDVMDVHVIKTDTQGNQIWDKTLGNKPFYDFGNDIMEMADGSFFVTGTTKSIVKDRDIYNNDVYLIKLDPDGNVLWENKYGGSGTEWVSSAAQKGKRDIITVGYTNSTGSGFFDLLVLRLRNH